MNGVGREEKEGDEVGVGGCFFFIYILLLYKYITVLCVCVCTLLRGMKRVKEEEENRSTLVTLTL